MTNERLTYIVHNEAWYAAAVPPDRGVTDEVNMQRQALTADGHEDGVFWEFTIRWHDLGHDTPAPRIEIFDDAWQAFAEVPDLFADLARRSDTAPSVAVVRSVLERHGFEDATARVRT